MSDSIDDSPSIEEPPLPQEQFSWHRLVSLDELPQGRVSTVTIGQESLCVTHTPEGGYGCLANALPASGRATRRRVYRGGMASLSLARL